MLLRVFPRINALFTTPNARLEAFRLLRTFPVSPSIDATLRVPTFAVAAIRLVVRLARFAIDTTFRVPTFAVAAMML